MRLDWSPPGRPNGITLGYEILRWTQRPCAAGVGEEPAGVGEEKFTCSYVQCPAGLGVCGTSCFHPESQVSVFFLRLSIKTFATQQEQRQCGEKKKRTEGSFAHFIDALNVLYFTWILQTLCVRLSVGRSIGRSIGRAQNQQSWLLS